MSMPIPDLDDHVNEDYVMSQVEIDNIHGDAEKVGRSSDDNRYLLALSEQAKKPVHVMKVAVIDLPNVQGNPEFDMVMDIHRGSVDPAA